MGTHLSSKYDQKLLDTAKKSTTDAIKTASKRAIQKIAEATGDLIVNKIADKIKITNVSKQSNKELPKELPKEEINTYKKKISLQKKDSKLLMN